MQYLCLIIFSAVEHAKLHYIFLITRKFGIGSYDYVGLQKGVVQ